MNDISLNGQWTLLRLKTGELFPATVPGVVHTDLEAAGVIDRPYYRDNEARYAWIGREDWAYRREFELDSGCLSWRAHRLVFEGLDTFATIVLNGTELGRTENMFRRYEFDVTGLLRSGRNELEVIFASPFAKAAELAAGLARKIPYAEEDEWVISRTNRNLIRKCQCHGGWDWGPGFLAMGIWRDVGISSFDELKIDYVKPVQEHLEKEVNLRVYVYVDVAAAGTYELTIAAAGQSVKQRVELAEGRGEVEAVLALGDPELWWPLGLGKQKLHQLSVSFARENRLVAEEQLQIGLRRVELIREDDRHGQSFYLRINGEPVFLKGYNWIPADCFTPRMTRETYADLIESAALAHCGVLRVWGGGIYEDDVFYQICDEKGILVWQDFMFACAMYPWDDAFLANVAAEVRHQMRRLSPHPCIILWCGNNECEAALPAPSATGDRDRFVAGYHKLFVDTIGRIAAQERPDLPYWPSSPSNGPEEYGDTSDETRGDVHFWAVWHGRKPFAEYLKSRPRFVSEFGFQSFSSAETLLTALEPEDLNVSSPMMDYRQRSHIGNSAIISQMMNEYRLPLDFEKFVYLSQVQQAMAMKMACEHWRRLKPLTMGAIIWQLNDLWPAISWSAIEYGGKWKVLNFFAKRFFAPVLLSVVRGETGLEVWATSDLPSLAQGRFRLEILDFTGTVLRSIPESYKLAPQESRCLRRLVWEELAGGRGLSDIFLVLRGEDGEANILNWEFLAPVKTCPLPCAKVQYEARQSGDRTEITLLADRPAFHVWLEIPGRRGLFDDNAFLLLPGQRKKVIFTPRDGLGPVKTEAIKLLHLRDTF